LRTGPAPAPRAMRPGLASPSASFASQGNPLSRVSGLRG
jgi:hypothetical protein